MKYMEHSIFEQLSAFLKNRKSGPLRINGRVELYSIGKEPRIKQEDGATAHTAANTATNTACTLSSTSLTSTSSTPSTTTGSAASINTSTVGRSRSASVVEVSSDIKRVKRHRSNSLGDLDDISSQKVLLALIGTMNESFPDYDFSIGKISDYAYIYFNIFTNI